MTPFDSANSALDDAAGYLEEFLAPECVDKEDAFEGAQ